jgi:hypothetical protein
MRPVLGPLAGLAIHPSKERAQIGFRRQFLELLLGDLAAALVDQPQHLRATFVGQEPPPALTVGGDDLDLVVALDGRVVVDDVPGIGELEAVHPESVTGRWRGTPQPMRANDTRGVEAPGVKGNIRRGLLRFAPAIAVLLLAAPGCTAPALTTSAYGSKAANTAEEVVSASRTVLLAAQVGDERRSFPQTIAVTIADAEIDAGSARDAFVSIQPPDAASDEIRATLLPDVQRACDVIAEVRIAARRGDIGGLSQVAAPLEQLADELDDFATRYA